MELGGGGRTISISTVDDADVCLVSVCHGHESGLLRVAFPPDFPANFLLCSRGTDVIRTSELELSLVFFVMKPDLQPREWCPCQTVRAMRWLREGKGRGARGKEVGAFERSLCCPHKFGGVNETVCFYICLSWPKKKVRH